MPPVPELEPALEQTEKPEIPAQPYIDGDSIVISGMAGMFPMANNVKEFSKNLYDKVNMVSNEPRFKHNHPELQQYCGNIPTLSPFDAQFFGVHAKLSATMDPMSRKLLEQTYQAIYDAGMSIDHVRATKLGVFIGSCFSETEKSCFYSAENRTGFGIMGCCKAMFANRISYWLDAKGPSMSMDCLCASSLVALENAFEAIRRGDCDAAIVGSANIILHPQSSILLGRSLQLSADGKARSFDKNAGGTVRAEAVNVLYIQKAKYAKRIYAEVCHVRCAFEAGNQEIFGPYRTVPLMRNFFTNFYREANISPNQVEYVEAYGTGIPDADKNELEAIGEVFCKDRSEPLLVGSVISNMGFSEAAAGICSVIKVCLGYHTGKYAANLHCDDPRDDVKTLREGQMRIVTNHTATGYGYAAVNNFAIGGMNCHVLLKGYNNAKNIHIYNSNIPYLVTVSGRHEAAVQHVIDDLKAHPVDAEEIALLQHIHERSTIGHMARGYCILSTNETNETNETKVLGEKSDYYADIKRPVWFVYSGMGSQWATMGTELMRLPVFANAIERCRRILEPKGVDIVDIITNPDKTTFDNILHSFVGIAAVQIGLTDVLRELGIVPDKIIGHSVGELGCAYADCCFTAEEMILSAYSRGLVSVQTPFIHGSMAAVGLGFSTVNKMCPPEIEVACHNSAESSTISGPSEIMKEFVAKLTAQGVFAKEVPCSNIAYHSRYIAEAGPKLKEYLSGVIPNPKPRSEKWVSTSVPQDRWNWESAKFSSAEYHTNNLLNPVLFEETARLIPANAVTIEIAPHGLLQAIIKRSLGESVTNIALTRRGHTDPITFLLNAIGQMYMIGMNPKLSVLYPKINFPISTGTATLSHQIKWVHTEAWPLLIFASANASTAAQRNILISTYDDEYKFTEDYVINDKIILPLSSILVIVWETFAMIQNKDKNLISIQLSNIHSYNDAVIHRNELVRLTINMQRGSGRFEVTKDNNLVLHGFLNESKTAPQAIREEHTPVLSDAVDTYDLDLNDIYKIMFRKGYTFKNAFRSIQKSNYNFTTAEVAWNDDWTTFLDSILQLSVLTRNHSGVSRPKFIRKITIDTVSQKRDVLEMKNTGIKAVVRSVENTIVCAGVCIEGIEYVDSAPVHTPAILKKQEFMPFYTIGNVSLPTALHAYLQIVAKNTTAKTIRAVEIKDVKEDNTIGKALFKVTKELTTFDLSLKRVTDEEFAENKDLGEIHLVLGNDIIANKSIYKELTKILPTKAFILNIETISSKDDSCFTVIAKSTTPIGQLALIRWHPVIEPSTVTCLSVENDCALLKYTKENLKNKDRLIITSKYPAESSLKALVEQWSKENNNIQLYLSDEKMISDEHFYEGSKRNLTYNVFKNGVWGSEFYLPLEKDEAVRDLKLTNIPGYLDCLKWVETSNNTSTNGFRVKVHYAGPTYYDIQKASGQIPIKGKDNYYGMDFSGVTQAGTKVMGIISEGSVGSSVDADSHLIWPVPAHWTLEDAATVPLPYIHAYYCLFVKGKLRPGSTILVHGGAGALGQAVISIALGLRCNVFTTVSTVQKKKFLLKLFPELKEANISNSRNGVFETTVMYGTNGKGCTIVINSLKGQLREVSMRCVGYDGYFIDVNAHDMTKNENFNMFFLSELKHYLPTNLSSLFKEENAADRIKLQSLLIEGIKLGYVRPLSRVTYAPHDVARAFKLLATSSHRGRVLLRMNELSSLAASPSIVCSPHSSYIVLCDKNEFGIDVADRLVMRGARNLILHCDTTLNTGLLRQKINSWKDIGVKVILNIEPLHTNNNHIKLLSKSIGVGPVEGVFIADEYKPAVVEGLDKGTRKMCNNLKYFAILRFGTEEFDLYEKSILSDRNKISLPTTLMQYPALRKFDDAIFDEEANTKLVKQNIFSALSALEVALRLKQPLPICTYAVDNNDVDILADMSSILGVNITEKIPPNTCLSELGLDLEKAEITSRYLENIMKKPFDREEIAHLTIAKLLDINTPIYDKTRKEASDLSMFFTKVDPEELDASINMVIMDTKITTRQSHNQFDPNESYLVIIPGLEGHYAMFKRLCERLKLHTIVLQPVLEQYNDSVEETAASLLTVMKKNMHLHGKKFYLLGYSFGSLVAMEMASLLEAQGVEGTVYCMDSSPAVFQKQLNRVIGHMSEPQLQDSIAEQMCRLMTSEGIEPLKKELTSARNWNEKVVASLKHLKGRVPHSVQYARLLIESAYGRIRAARDYNPDNLGKLNSPIILLKGRVPEELTLEYDYGLSKYSKGQVTVYELDCDHLGATQDLRCSNIVNRHLDDDIIKAFSEKNHCDTYLENPTQFVGVAQ